MLCIWFSNLCNFLVTQSLEDKSINLLIRAKINKLKVICHIFRKNAQIPTEILRLLKHF